jgi:hypothetical protein
MRSEPVNSGRRDAAIGVLRLAEGAVGGAALGLVAALAYTALDPHLRPELDLAAAHSAPDWMRCFAAAGLIAAGLAVAAGERVRALRVLPVALGLAVPVLGLVASAALSPAALWSLEPKELGAVVTTSERTFGIGFGVAALLLAAAIARRMRAWEVPASGAVRRAVPAAGLIAAAVLLAWAGGTGASPAPGGPTRPAGGAARVVLVGIDGADWDVIDPMLARGELPVLRELVEGGASGPLATFRPTVSPLIWTTIATGQPPGRHGILDFLEAGSEVPYTSNARREPALWSWLGERGVPVGVFGWWVTWPAEPVRGYLVSSYSAPDGPRTIKGTLHAGLPRQTHPPELMRTLEPAIPQAIAWARARVRRLLAGYTPPAADVHFQDRVRVTTWVLRADHLFAQAAVRIAREHAPRFLAVYLSAPDTVGHAFCESNPWASETCGRVLSSAYGAVDRALGDVLEAAGPDRVAIVASDHGFDLARGHSHGWLQGPPGIVVLHGEGVRAGARVDAASVYDVAPTVLALFGLPVPEDWRGRPLLGAFEPEQVERMRVGYRPPLPSEERPPASYRPIASPADAELKHRLRALGYIE